jgi:acetylornithine deacetylase/succinyl-diaminopimelate desuccinylase-like protein
VYLRIVPLLFISTVTVSAQPVAPETYKQLAVEILAELVAINTGVTTGSTAPAAELLAARLIAAGFEKRDVVIVGESSRTANLVVRYAGAFSGKPMLVLGHLDVVEAKRNDWATDPFKLTEQNGQLYGRGTIDDKSMLAIWVANLIRYRKEKFRPERGIILALTANEEAGGEAGLGWILRNHRNLIDVEFCINEGGYGRMKEGKPAFNELQVAEKVTANFTLDTKSKGGHSSRPEKDNAIYRLSRALDQTSKLEFPVKLTDVAREYFRRSATLASGSQADNMRAVAQGSLDAARHLADSSPAFNAQLRSTCVATQMDGGNAQNALPESARATLNCRILPGDSVEGVQRSLVTAVNDTQVTITLINKPKQSLASPIQPDILRATEVATQAIWPGVPVIPSMISGGTDGAWLRAAGIPTYGVTGLFSEGDTGVHGRDEHIGVQQFYEALGFHYLLGKALTQDHRTTQ